MRPAIEIDYDNRHVPDTGADYWVGLHWHSIKRGIMTKNVRALETEPAEEPLPLGRRTGRIVVARTNTA